MDRKEYVRSTTGMATRNDITGITVTDIDGNVYRTVTIGTQVWMVEDLRTTTYRNGDPITNGTEVRMWMGLTKKGVYCNYDNDANSAKIHGRLYNWYAVDDSRNISPTGWHVATDAEWKTLTDYLGGEAVAGGKLKEMGTTHWTTSNKGADNSSGFTALPGGHRVTNGAFLNIGDHGFWWSSTELYKGQVWYWSLGYSSSSVYRDWHNKTYGFAVRCVRD